MNNQWMKTLKIQNMFGKRRKNNRGVMWWTSVIGLGVGAAAYGAKRRQNGKANNPLNNIMNTLNNQTKKMDISDLAGITEFSKELTNKNQQQKDSQ